ncbi:YSIRK-type signal peptide-containing protein, partial [Streptococcus sp. 959]|uniref:YSIRK-type signal peptide-containing protein n=1 Tax=Streptococcus sp. 959 TaxID=2582655 RepID=UPI00156350A3
MENKSNSLNRIKRQQREKILRFSIRKYSFGAASVAVAALMFLGARVASADSLVDKTSHSTASTAGVVTSESKVDLPEDTESTANKVDEGHKSPENQAPAVPANNAPTVDKDKLRKVVEELNALLSTKLNLDESVVSPVKDRLQKGKEALESSELAQKDIDELAELLSKDVTVVSAAKEVTEVQVDKKVDKQVDKQADKTEKQADNLASQTSPEVSASEESQTVSAKKDALKVSVDQLKAAVLELPERETSKEVLEKANELLGLAQGVLENTTVSLNDVEDMTKRVKRMFNSVKNATTRLTSGARDPRNGKSMGQGTGGRAATVSSQWTKQDNLLIYQRFRATDFYGNIRNNDRQFTENKVDMTARTQMIDGQKYLVYDVFFNNDGRSMVNLSRQQLYNVILPPKILDLQSNGLYKSDTIRDLYFETYRRNNQNEGGTLSQNPDKFRYESTQHFHFKNDHDVSKGRLTYFYNVGVRQNNAYNQDMRDNFKNNKNDQFLKDAVALDGVYKQWSYGIGVKTNDPTAAVHMHFKAKLRPGVTDEAVQKAFTLAIAGTYGGTTNQSYVFGSGKKNEENVEPTLGEKQNKRYPIIGKEVTKTVGDSLEENPVASGLVTRDNGTKEFPDGMSWEFLNGKPNTNTAGVFKPQVKATYSDNSSNTTTATLIVKPKKPAITTSVENKKGLIGQQITVNVGSGVPKGSTVNLYDGNKIIGTVKTNGGETATVTVTEALPGKSITAVTVVTNTDGTVTSDKSNPVTPTEAPDTQKPTLEISRKSQTVVEGEKVTFTITARDNKVVTIEGKDFTDKYGDRLLSRQATNNKVKITDTEKIIEITITTKKEDVGKPHTITFGAHDDAGNKADPVTFTFNVTPRDNQKPIVEVGGVRLTENEPQSAQFYVYRGATFNPTVKAWDDSGNIKSMSVENLPNGSKAQTYTPQTGKDGSTDDKKYTTSLSTGTVADTQTLGDHVAKFKISDGVNNAIYKMKYKVVDVVVENTPKTVELNSKSGDPNEYLNTAGKQDKSGKPVVESQADVHFPGGMKFRWDNANGSDTNITLSKVGTQTHKAIAVFPKNPSQRGSVQVFAPEKAERDVVFNVVDNEKPKASLNGKELSETANEPIFTVYRGATFNPELKVSDNSGVISKVEVKGGLPKGVTPDPGATPSTFTAQTGKDGSSEDKKYKTRLSSGTVLDTETLGVHESTIHVEGSNPSDSRDFKFKYRVVDIETKNVDKNGIAKVPVASTLNKDNSSKNIDAHNYLKVVDSEDKADRGNNYLPSGMTWTWKDRNGVNKDRGTTLDNSGKYTRTATAIFPGTKANNMTDATSTTRDVFAPAEIKRKVILAVTPTAPIVEGKENGSVTITPPKQPDSTNQQDIDKITLTYTPTGQTSPETVTVTKSGSKWTVNGKSDDKVSVSPEGVVTISDAEIADKTEVTAKVSKNIDGVLTLESPVARGTANGPLAAEVINPAPVPEKAQITPVTVVTPNKPGSSITVDGPVNGLTVDDEGKLKGKPEVNDWKPKEEERTVEIPVKVTKGGETVTVKVPVPILRDTDGDGIPDKEDSDDDNDGIPDEEEIKNGTDPKTPETEKPVEIEITPQPNGDAIVTPKKPGGGTYPPGTKVEIPGEDGNTITVEIGKDGSGKVPNDKLPKKAVPGTGTVTEPNKKPSQPVNVTTPARKTPTIELKPDPKTGDVTVTPQRPGGGTYPPGTTVEIPGEDGPITVEIGKDGKGKVPNDKLPKKDVPGTGKITEPGKPAVEVPNVTTPAKVTPETPETEKPVEIEITPQPNGDAIVTPKKPG